jgi:hypothetical protein
MLRFSLFSKGSSGKVSMLEKEDVVVVGSSCGDSDLGTSKKKVPVVQDMPSASPVDGKTNDGSLYTKMQGLLYLVQCV